MKTWRQYVTIDLIDDQNNLVRITHNGVEIEDIAKVFVSKDNGQVLGFGTGYHSPADVETIEVIPIRNGGVIVDFAHWEAFISHMIAKAMEGTRFWRLRLKMADVRIKGPLYEIEHRALVDSLKHAGIRDVQVTCEKNVISCSGNERVSITDREKKLLDKKLQLMLKEKSQSAPVRTAMCYCPAPKTWKHPFSKNGKDIWDFFDDNEE